MAICGWRTSRNDYQNLRFNTEAVRPQAMLPSPVLKSHIEATEMMSELRTLLEKVLAAQSAGA